MSIAVPFAAFESPALVGLLRQFTVDEYHQMLRDGILAEGEPLELLDGWIVHKMTRNPEHDLALERLDQAIREIVPKGWRIRIQSAITTEKSEPEPDLAIVRGPMPSKASSHPRPLDVALLVEVADSSLEFDRTVKAAAYARASIQVYWIVNLPERQLEVLTDPSGSVDSPTYATRRIYRADESAPLVLDGVEVGGIAVKDLV